MLVQYTTVISLADIHIKMDKKPNHGLLHGNYRIMFAVDYPMDGILDINGAILVDSVSVTVQ
jgi:hypothetical protein